MNIEVLVYRRPNMFNVQNHPLNLIGYNELENMFSIENYDANQSDLSLIFPERFLNILEQRRLILNVEKCNYNKVTIITHSVYIIQCCKNEYVKICDEAFPETSDRFRLSHVDSFQYDGKLIVL